MLVSRCSWRKEEVEEEEVAAAAWVRLHEEERKEKGPGFLVL